MASSLPRFSVSANGQSITVIQPSFAYFLNQFSNVAHRITGETKKKVGKEAAMHAETVRNQVRHVRQAAMKVLRQISDRDEKGRMERQVQVWTDRAIQQIDKDLSVKLKALDA